MFRENKGKSLIPSVPKCSIATLSAAMELIVQDKDIHVFHE